MTKPTAEQIEAAKELLIKIEGFADSNPMDGTYFDKLSSAIAQFLADREAKNGEVLGYVNVYRDADGDIELGSTDLDEAINSTWAGMARSHVDYLGRGQVKLIDLPEVES